MAAVAELIQIYIFLFGDGNMPHIIILTETWFSNENTWNIECYSSYTIPPDKRPGGFQYT